MIYEAVKGGAIVAGIAGAALLLEHVASQLRIGWGSEWTLLAGVGLPIVSLLFWMVADIGSRLPPHGRTKEGDL